MANNRMASNPFPFGAGPTTPNAGQVRGHGVAPFPNYGLPGPVGDPTEPIRPSYLYPETELVWQAAAGAVYANAAFGSTTAVTRRAIWQTPVFDMAYDLGNTNSIRSEGTRISGSGCVQATIRTFDPAGVTFVAALSSNLQPYSIEASAIYDARQIRYHQERVNCATQFFAGTECVTLVWEPPGSPVRYWRVTLFFDWIGIIDDVPRLMLAAGVH